jgi:uncharacterized membrane protein
MKSLKEKLRTSLASISMTIVYSTAFSFVGWITCTFICQNVLGKKLVDQESTLIVMIICFVFGSGVHLIAEKIDSAKNEILKRISPKER